MEFLGHIDQFPLPMLSCLLSCVSVLVPGNIFLCTVVRECLGLKVVVWKVRRGQGTSILERLGKETS